MNNVGVLPGDSRDSFGRGRFFAINPEFHISPEGRPGATIDKSFWYWNYILYDAVDGLACCSDQAVSFHYIEPVTMYLMEYLIYHLRVHGVEVGATRLKRGTKNRCSKVEEDKSWEAFKLLTFK